MKKIILLLTVLMCLACLAACNEATEPTKPATDLLEYAVQVTDRSGEPVSASIIVHFISGDTTVAMQAVGPDGFARKMLKAGEYTVQIAFVDPSVSFSADLPEGIHLTPENTTLSVKLDQALWGGMTLNGYSIATGEYRDFEAKSIGTGTSRVPLTKEERTYILFAPTEAGLYRFYAEGADVTIGYYGSPFLVQQWNLAETLDDGSFNVSIAESMIGTGDTGTTVLVLGIDSTGAEACFVTIERIGDPIKNIEDYEWEIYAATTKPAPFTLPADIQLQEFDLKAGTDAYQLIFNEADGFYHLNETDGPVVFFKLGVKSDYLDSIQKVLDTSGINRYFFDEDGEFLKKISYSECLLEYISCMDESSGLYPLTDDLMHIIKQRGEYVGWWDPDSGIYLFLDSNGNRIPGINHEIAWLFNCCYGTIPEILPPETQPDSQPDRPTEPTEPEKTIGHESPEEEVSVGLMEEFTATVKAGEYANYMIYRVMSTVYLTIESNDAYVIYKDRVYWPENGVVTVVLKGSPMNNSMSLAIGNSSKSDTTFTVHMGNPKGAQTNPYTLNIGKNKVSLEEGNEIGAYFTCTAQQTGMITITVNKVTNKALANIVVNVTTGDITAQYSITGSDPVTIAVQAGDKLELIVSCADANNSFKHPAATVEFTLEYNG